jgi:2,4-dienoyl-CoA reductase-like NADH-dependent reductase (Old Yellow Enzyme family)/thioredoxin reductase
MSNKLLFTKGKIGSLELRNRIVMPPMGTNMAAFDGEASDEIIDFYEERAKGGCGLIITEICRIDEGAGAGMLHQLSATSPKYIRGLERLADAVHKYDTKIFLQLHHPGREISSYQLGGIQPVAPSAIPCKAIGETPRELTTEECGKLVRRFVRAASYAKLAGMDGVELHGAHGYLIDEFLSPYSNKRTDKYGGSFEGRLTFLAEIVTGIRKKCGPKFPISVRLSCDEYVDGGLRLEDSVKIAKALEKLGVSSINVSAGVYESGYAIIEPQGFPEGWKKHLAAEIKRNVSIPVIAVNNIKYPSTAEKYLEEGISDFVAIGRGQLSDPQWGNKAKEGKEDEIRKCLGCMYCFRTLGLQRPIECTVNPYLGREYILNDDNLARDGAGRTIAVIGGGPGGMQAAIICAKRGYNVTLYEKSVALGGTMQLAAKPPRKEMIAELIKTMEGELKRAGVKIVLDTEATVDKVKALDPYGVILAVGGLPIVPAIPGIDSSHVCTAEQVLAGDVKLSGKKIAVIGGGVTGLETAEVLSEDNKVTIVEMKKDVGDTLYITVKMMLLNALKSAGVKIMTSQKLAEVKKDCILLNDVSSDETKELKADTVVLAMGVRPDSGLAEKFETVFPHVTRVGDVSKPAQIADAVREGNDKARVI